jgi:NTE family protein
MKRNVRVAFVGSGGAARGLAHLGVLRACEELGIRPEIFVGASAGAIVGATYGQGIPLDILIDGYRLPWKRRHQSLRVHTLTFFGLPTLRQILDPGHLFSGLFSIDKLERALRQALPINDFRKLPNPVLVTAVDLDRAQRVVFGPGHDDAVPISQAVAASCCVPGLFRPHKIGDRYHLDGEVVRTLSADLAIEAGADVVIISSIYRPEVTREGDRSIARRGALSVLTQTINIVLTQKEHTGVQLHTRTYPNVRFVDIAPDIGMFGYLNRFAARALVMRGYKCAIRTLSEAKARGVFGDVAPVAPRLAHAN